MDSHKILLVEEDAKTSKMLKKQLMMENYKIICVADGQEACRLFDSTVFSLVLLDLMMPGNGMDVIRHIRKNSVVPVIVLSSSGSDAVKTQVFNLGADDFITKPFSVAEVIARIQASIRRVTHYTNYASTSFKILSAGDLTMNLLNYTVLKCGKEVDLTVTEFEILKIFLQNPNETFTKEQIYSLVWNESYLDDGNAVSVHISNLRNKIEDCSRDPQYIITVRGVGYKLGVPSVATA